MNQNRKNINRQTDTYTHLKYDKSWHIKEVKIMDSSTYGARTSIKNNILLGSYNKKYQIEDFKVGIKTNFCMH